MAERGKLGSYSAAEQTKKIAMKSVDSIKGQHNSFIFLKGLMINSYVCICNLSPLLSGTSYHLLGYHLLVEEHLERVHSSGC